MSETSHHTPTRAIMETEKMKEVDDRRFVRWNPDGSITVSPDGVETLLEELHQWSQWDGWTKRDDCKNWKRSPIARENRRECIVYGNCLGFMKKLLGWREVNRRISPPNAKAEPHRKEDDE